MEIIRKKFGFKNHLGENNELLETIQAAATENTQTLLIAPCSAGKTFTVLTQIAANLPKRNVVLLVPTVAQALQTKRYGTNKHTVYVAAGADSYIRSDEKTTTATYDKAHQLTEWDWDYLAKTTLIIDEAHMLVTEKSYRDRAIKGVFEAIKHILVAGGSVIYLTATPRRIRFEQFFSMNGATEKVQIMTCEKEDETGNVCPQIRPKKLRLLRKPAKLSTYQCVLDLVAGYHTKGKIPLILYNDKCRIDQLIFQLEEKGIRSFRLTSDDKAFVQEEIVDEYGFVMERETIYVNEAYGSVIENEVLPDAHAYLCTSMIEAGTNIKGIQTEEGILQPEDLIPIFVCKNRNEFDLDKIIQFLSRVRFDTEEAVILLGTPAKEPSQNAVRLQTEEILKEAEQELSRKRLLPQIANLRDFDGTTARPLTAGELYDYVSIVDEVWKRYDGALFAAVDDTASIMTELLGVPTETVFLCEKKKEEEKQGKCLDEETKKALREVLWDSHAMKSLLCSVMIDQKIPSIGRLLRFPDGLRVLKETQSLCRLSTLSREDVLLAIEEKMQARRGIGKDVISAAEKSALLNLAKECSERKLEQILQYHTQKETGRNVERNIPLSSITSDVDLQCTIDYLAESRRMKLLNGMNRHQYFDGKLKRLFEIGGSRDCKELEMLEKQSHYIYLNGFSDKSKELRKLQVYATKAHAEYLVLRFPEKYLVDEKGRHQWMREVRGRLRKEDIETIRKFMPASVKRLAKGYKRNGTYSTEKIWKHFKAIYKVRERDEKCPAVFEVLGLRTRLQQLDINTKKAAGE